MKNQYFGDKNDFFKYDLVLNLVEEIDEITTLTFVPMLTRGDGSANGHFTEFRGNRRPELEKFLKNCIIHQKRNIKNLRIFMAKYTGIRYLPYRDDSYINMSNRDDYFNSLTKEYLKDSAILIDPDNGFEIKSMTSKNESSYLKYDELKKIYKSMSENSLAVVYQHIPRVQREQYFEAISEKIYNSLDGAKVACITDNVVAYFIICKSVYISDLVWKILNKYAHQNAYKAYKYSFVPTLQDQDISNDIDEIKIDKYEQNINRSNKYEQNINRSDKYKQNSNISNKYKQNINISNKYEHNVSELIKYRNAKIETAKDYRVKASGDILSWTAPVMMAFVILILWLLG